MPRITTARSFSAHADAEWEGIVTPTGARPEVHIIIGDGTLEEVYCRHLNEI